MNSWVSVSGCLLLSLLFNEGEFLQIYNVRHCTCLLARIYHIIDGDTNPTITELS